ncbi:S41 family peptidase [Candidatus Oleimmundimicrobium sp.]|uniref:S41 family peptidase n=1 Tax=Candidatus Oleimmundimicrobium sp. TaxID=3060597 RepID=UPI00271F7FDA|nr:S41 family peptidase [Candidatus Oleimmundimicrobium sp.]MDO8885697.1 S41 family peptidase [Candidatus Oleimmundimicrobium sp.]
MKKKILVVVGIILLSAVFLTGVFAAGFYTHGKMLEIRAKNVPSLDLLKEAISEIKQNYVKDVSDSELIRGAIKGAAESLGDPYTRYLNGEEAEILNEEMHGEFDGIGAYLGLKDDKLTVISPIEGAPAEKAGIKAGDLIIKIDEKLTDGMSLEEAVSLIKGERGTKVVLTIIRKGIDGPIVFEVVREKIFIPNVISKILDKDIGYVRLHIFNDRIGEDLDSALKKLKNENAKGIILDLRNNPGGVLDGAINVASKFIESGVVVTVKDKNGNIESCKTKGTADSTIPLVILVNEGSASASEIVAGAIQDHGRGVLVGCQTFGKASVQSVIKLSDGSRLVITTAHYFTPNGRDIHEEGIKPDFIVEIDEESETEEDSQLEKAKSILRELLKKKEAA